MRPWYLALLLLTVSTFGGGCSNGQDAPGACTTDNTLDTSKAACTMTVGIAPSVTFSASATMRTVMTNSIPDHMTGQFPNANNPNTISAQNIMLDMPLNGTAAASPTPLLGANGPDYAFGVALNGIEFDPVAAEPWAKGTPQQNWSWVLEATVNNLGLDCNNAHVQPNGKYHYHGTPTEYITTLGLGGDMTLAGYAADGFPIYWLYGYNDPNDGGSGVKQLAPSYQLRSGERPGDGVTAPCGAYNGKYVQDYEYVPGSGDLDEFNGRMGVTPESPVTPVYYYVVTEAFPGVPRQFRGTPDPSFAIGPP